MPGTSPCIFKMLLWRFLDGLCDRWHLQAKKMGCIIFQFPLSFAPSDDNRRHIEWCRSNIRNSLEMAVEFRARSWFSTQEACTATVVRYIHAGFELNILISASGGHSGTCSRAVGSCSVCALRCSHVETYATIKIVCPFYNAC